MPNDALFRFQKRLPLRHDFLDFRSRGRGILSRHLMRQSELQRALSV
jgi:hypothetical protein